MKIGLIGNIVLDEIRTLIGTVTKSWGGAFTLEYLRGSDAIRSAEIANSIAGAVCSMSGVEDILFTDFNYIMGTNG